MLFLDVMNYEIGYYPWPDRLDTIIISKESDFAD
jgi:hypothetical protein